MPRTRHHTLADKATRVIAVATVSGLAALAAWISYRHMLLLAERSHERGLDAHAFPLTVDGLDLIGVLVLLADRRSGRRSGWLPWTVVAIGTLASIAANIAVAPDNPIARAISGWSAVALLAAAKMLAHLFEPPDRSQPGRRLGRRNHAGHSSTGAGPGERARQRPPRHRRGTRPSAPPPSRRRRPTDTRRRRRTGRNGSPSGRPPSTSTRPHPRWPPRAACRCAPCSSSAPPGRKATSNHPTGSLTPRQQPPTLSRPQISQRRNSTARRHHLTTQPDTTRRGPAARAASALRHNRRNT